MNQSAKVSDTDIQYETNTRPLLTEHLGKSCPKLVLTNGQLACTGNLFEDNCKFECNEGFTLKGEDRASCTVNIYFIFLLEITTVSNRALVDGQIVFQFAKRLHCQCLENVLHLILTQMWFSTVH